MALVMTNDGREVESDVKCVVDGCDEYVVTHKGATAGYCTKVQKNGKTHRQERMAVMKANGTHFGKPRGSANKRVQRNLPGVDWLTEVKVSINLALDEVVSAEDELDKAKYRLRSLLEEAQGLLQ